MAGEGGFPSNLASKGLSVRADGRWRSVLELLGTISLMETERAFPILRQFSPRVRQQISDDAHYAPYTDRQAREIASFRRDETVRLDAELDYGRIGALSAELRVKLEATRPASLGAAGRIEGMTPAALIALSVYARSHSAVSRET